MDALPRRMNALFSPDAPKLWTIPPGANFLDELAHALAEATGLADNPLALADALIYVPNNRSREALAFALTRASQRGACLLPDIRALGDLETQDPPPSVETALADLPPAMPNARRIGELARLVLAYYQTQSLTVPAASALVAARELASLLDQAALSGEVDWSKLDEVVERRDMAQHWRQSLDFLKIITEQWPAKLDDATAMDPYARRYAAAEAMAQAWTRSPPDSPVIIAGSTGATPASRLLMRAALSLPKGLIVLPGLDRDMPAATWQSLKDAPSHPQFALARTLSALDVAPASVAIWPGPTAPAFQSARRRLIHEALAPAEQTHDWTERLTAMATDGDPARFAETALQGLTLIEAADDSDEALAATLLLRAALEREGETAALVTPDAGLARHVSALLRQWQIEVTPSAGLPLLQTPQGSFAFLVLDWLSDPSHPVKLMAVLNNPLCCLDPDAITRLDRHFLRGPRVWHDMDTLIQHIETASDPDRRKYKDYTDADIAAALALVRQIDDALSEAGAPGQMIDHTTGRAWYGLAASLMQTLSEAPDPWRGRASGDVATLINDLCDMSDPLGDQPAHIFTDLFKAEAVRVSVRSGQVHPRLAIWGPLEARLQTADHIIMAGLNEGIWPAQPAADAFLPRAFRKEIGIADPDERIGLSAHDFAQLAAAPHVTLLTSRRRDDKPVVASRWIWRLRTLARGALQKDGAEAALAPAPADDPRTWIKALETAPALPEGFTAEPRPRPPRAARPTGLSATRIETLVRDPYAIYGQYVLGLNKLAPLNLPSDVRIRGTAIHKALEDFESDGQDRSVDALVALLEAELRKGGESEAALIALREKRREVATEYLTWRAEAVHRIEGRPITEEKGKTTLSIEGEDFTLSGTADRIERRLGGGVAILDFKSGQPPTEKQVRSGLSPQMPLQGLIAQRGGYPSLGTSVSIEALTYIQFGTRFDVREIGNPGKRDERPVADIISDTEAGLVRLLTQFADPGHPYLSAPRPHRVIYESDYSRLARRAEWAGIDSYD